MGNGDINIFSYNMGSLDRALTRHCVRRLFCQNGFPLVSPPPSPCRSPSCLCSKGFAAPTGLSHFPHPFIAIVLLLDSRPHIQGHLPRAGVESPGSCPNSPCVRGIFHHAGPIHPSL